ncbi:MAG TPA: hypothetical protein VFY26_14430 [Anaerolineales bacterium]|nr:hypothetical protein [Anaerolineales bacterium]
MNFLKTLLYMGNLHGFFTFHVPFLLAGLGLMLFEARIFPVIGLPHPVFWHNWNARVFTGTLFK